jgi:UDP-N-acetylglucosamine--N-acetylmuramyl-(pentapeptide) pyrophosphoryl-undecaprenol N-acetylglucosamine transferase
MKIVFSGGGTLGPVTPLLQVYEVYKRQYEEAKFAWVGTKHGPERAIVEQAGIAFFAIGAGKWRRYFSWTNFGDIFRIIVAFFQSIIFIWQEKPDILISAGGFVSVPLHWAGAFLGIPAWVHQQDVKPGLAIKLMAPFARRITTALEPTARFFPAHKTTWLGNPGRNLSWNNFDEAYDFFGFKPGTRVILAMGGGTGSVTINHMVLEALPAWPKDWQVIHLIGRERPGDLSERAAKTFPNYHVYKFFTHEMKYAYAIADVVIARAGFGTLTELAMLKKPAIIIPMSGTHQEKNAQFFSKKQAIIELHGTLESGYRLAREVKELIEHEDQRRLLGETLHALLPRAPESELVNIVNAVARHT